MMPFREFSKNTRETVRVTPTRYEGHDLIDIRVYAKNREGEIVRTTKGISINVDTIPELIDDLIWALGQSCNADPERPERILSQADAERLATIAWDTLGKHGSAVHWDSAERIVLSKAPEFSKWDLHYVLATRTDLFERVDRAAYRARSNRTATVRKR
jgi:hypothetical protein